MLLPWEYGVRNLSRRPVRTALTLLALTIVIVLIFVVVGFIRGLEKSLAVSGDSNVVLVYSVNAAENIENSAIPARTPSLLSASVSGVREIQGERAVSAEIYMGTKVDIGDGVERFGLVRGVTPSVPLVRKSVQLLEGRWPEPGEVLIGELAAAKLGLRSEQLQINDTVSIEGREWAIAGRFAAAGASFESEIWCNLPDLQAATNRQDLSLVAVQLEDNASVGEVQLFCKERIDLELQAIAERAYYDSLQQHYRPVRLLAWLVVLLVSGSGIFAGLNMMYGAVSGRTREFATLQAIGYRRSAILLSIIQESVLLAAAAALLAGAWALFFVNNRAIRFTMGAFALQIDGWAILSGCTIGLLLGVCGAIPPAIKALRSDVATGLKAI